MNNSDITDPLFLEAVEAIDAGNLERVRELIEHNPGLVRKQLDFPSDGYFRHPYLLWFVAENPIRHEHVPANICEITGVLVDAVKKHSSESFQHQIDYTLGLVATGRIPRESGVQNKWIDLLIDAGAKPGNAIGALAHGNIEAAKHLLKRGAILTFPVAVGLGLKEEFQGLAKVATKQEKEIALMVASFYGNAEMIEAILKLGVDVNAYLDSSSGFHSHATALHQAVFSGSLESVKLLVDAGASLTLKDRIHDGNPVEWAEYMKREENDGQMKDKYSEIEKYLNNRKE